MKAKVKKIIVILIALVLLITIIFLYNLENKDLQYINYKEFNNEIENNNIQSVWIEDDKVKFSKYNDENLYYTDNPNYDEFKREILDLFLI